LIALAGAFAAMLMLGLDGLEATRRLKASPETASLPVIALAALAMNGDRERCMVAGADKYLTKPVNLRQLDALLDHLVGASVKASS
jgi:CheY-like chemotaxis protein